MLLRLLFLSLFAFAPAASLTAQTLTSPTETERAIALLQQLVATGAGLDREHDDGEWLQAAVTAAIRQGNTNVERLAVRASAFVRARVFRPVASVDDQLGLMVETRQLLSLPRPLPFSAVLEASVDGGAFVRLGRFDSGEGRSVDFQRLGPLARSPGAHQVQLRAHFSFGDPVRPTWTETRRLPSLYYALYDLRVGTKEDARWFIYSPASATAADLDPLLPREPVAVWLTGVLSSRRAGETNAPDWVSDYCGARTSDPAASPNSGAVCAVVYFAANGRMGEIWFRTGRIDPEGRQAVWVPEPPVVEAVVISTGLATSRLSDLPHVLDADAVSLHDVEIGEQDIVVTPTTPGPGGMTQVTVTVHNLGGRDLHNVLVQVVQLLSAGEAGRRHFVLDIPAFGTASVTLDAVFPRGYGVVGALAIPVTEHSPPMSHYLPSAACASRVVNPAAAPRDFLRSIGSLGECR